MESIEPLQDIIAAVVLFQGAWLLSRIADQGTDYPDGLFSTGLEQPKMPRYYFDTWDGNRFASDNEGVECADDKTACGAAAKAVLNLARDMVDGISSCELFIEVRDQAKKPVCRVTLQFEIEQLGQLE
jgi:Domain of unknown function (DUF6894)